MGIQIVPGRLVWVARRSWSPIIGSAKRKLVDSECECNNNNDSWLVSGSMTHESSCAHLSS